MTRMKRCCAKKGYVCDLSGELIAPGDGYYKIIVSYHDEEHHKQIKTLRIKASAYDFLDEDKRRYIYLYINDKKTLHRFFSNKVEKKAFLKYVKQKIEDELQQYSKLASYYSDRVKILQERLKKIITRR